MIQPQAIGDGEPASDVPLVLRVERILALLQVVYAEGGHLLEGLRAAGEEIGHRVPAGVRTRGTKYNQPLREILESTRLIVFGEVPVDSELQSVAARHLGEIVGQRRVERQFSEIAALEAGAKGRCIVTGDSHNIGDLRHVRIGRQRPIAAQPEGGRIDRRGIGEPNRVQELSHCKHRLVGQRGTEYVHQVPAKYARDEVRRHSRRIGERAAGIVPDADRIPIELVLTVPCHRQPVLVVDVVIRSDSKFKAIRARAQQIVEVVAGRIRLCPRRLWKGLGIGERSGIEQTLRDHSSGILGGASVFGRRRRIDGIGVGESRAESGQILR